MTTDLLHAELVRLTCVELDGALATELGARLRATNVAIVNADVTQLPFTDTRFTGAVVHHAPPV